MYSPMGYKVSLGAMITFTIVLLTSALYYGAFIATSAIGLSLGDPRYTGVYQFGELVLVMLAVLVVLSLVVGILYLVGTTALYVVGGAK